MKTKLIFKIISLLGAVYFYASLFVYSGNIVIPEGIKQGTKEAIEEYEENSILGGKKCEDPKYIVALAALENKDIVAMQYAIELGFNVDWSYPCIQPLSLAWAVEENDAPMVELLLSKMSPKGIDQNREAMGIAARKGNLSIIKLLAEHGFPIDGLRGDEHHQKVNIVQLSGDNEEIKAWYEEQEAKSDL